MILNTLNIKTYVPKKRPNSRFAGLLINFTMNLGFFNIVPIDPTHLMTA